VEYDESYDDLPREERIRRGGRRKETKDKHAWVPDSAKKGGKRNA
jgi:hypothetical protein